MNHLLSKSWLEFNAALMKLSEEEVYFLLKDEKRGQRRIAYLLRLYGRFSKLRNQRERGELLVRGTAQ